MTRILAERFELDPAVAFTLEYELHQHILSLSVTKSLGVDILSRGGSIPIVPKE